MFVKISPKEISENPIKLIGQDWMLISAGSPEKFNSMTASWGGIGFMWNKPVAFAVIRPTRYTFVFVESRKRFTLSFFSQNYKKALGIFGSKSGRDCDKVAESGLTPFFTESGAPAYEEAKLILDCSAIYSQTLDESAFLDSEALKKWYSSDPLHKLYVAEINDVLIRRQPEV
jgi:conserved protein/domain typically associated with flavoprotein oxygenases, DIM6/NTAB family